MKIPRPSGGSKQSDGVGKIYVKFDSADGASQALKTLAGRKFAERTVIASFFSEVSCDLSKKPAVANTRYRRTLTSVLGDEIKSVFPQTLKEVWAEDLPGSLSASIASIMQCVRYGAEGLAPVVCQFDSDMGVECIPE